MIAGIGIDIVRTERIRAARYFDRVAEYILLEEELTWMRESRDAIEYLASRLAVKEAVIKAFPSRLSYHDVVVEKDGLRPRARVCGPGVEKYQVHVSLSHEVDYTVACATICI